MLGPPAASSALGILSAAAAAVGASTAPGEAETGEVPTCCAATSVHRLHPAHCACAHSDVPYLSQKEEQPFAAMLLAGGEASSCSALGCGTSWPAGLGAKSGIGVHGGGEGGHGGGGGSGGGAGGGGRGDGGWQKLQPAHRAWRQWLLACSSAQYCAQTAVGCSQKGQCSQASAVQWCVACCVSHHSAQSDDAAAPLSACASSSGEALQKVHARHGSPGISQCLALCCASHHGSHLFVRAVSQSHPAHP